MKSYGYITLKEAESISGISIETIKKQCQAGRIRGAIKEAGSWFVPKDEIIIKPVKPGHADDNALALMVLLAEISGIGTNITLYMNGLVIEGLLISTKKYIEFMKDNIHIKLGYDDNETQKMINSTLNVHYDNILKSNEKSGYEFVHLEQPRVIFGGSFYEPQEATLRLKIESIDGFQLGTTKKIVFPDTRMPYHD